VKRNQRKPPALTRCPWASPDEPRPPRHCAAHAMQCHGMGCTLYDTACGPCRATHLQGHLLLRQRHAAQRGRTQLGRAGHDLDVYGPAAHDLQPGRMGCMATWFVWLNGCACMGGRAQLGRAAHEHGVHGPAAHDLHRATCASGPWMGTLVPWSGSSSCSYCGL